MGILRAGLAAVALAVALALPAAPAAQDDTRTLWERFELFTDCAPVRPVVESLSSDATDIGLTREGLQAAVDSRLLAARLYTESPESAPTLTLRVHVYENAFSVTLELRKRVWEPVAELTASAITWDTTGLGTHTGAAGFIRNIVAESMDEFLAEYLRVNYAACQ